MNTNTKELTEGNYLEALLRTALLLGDLHRTVPVHEITISGFLIQNHVRKLYPRCRMVVRIGQQSCPAEVTLQDTAGENYLILYPIRKSIPS